MVTLIYIHKIICIPLIIFLGISLSHAEQGRKTPSRDGVLSAGPYYNPTSKSYFELVRMQSGSGHSRWRHVNSSAQKRFFKNVPGHLATVKNLATHQFILRHFVSPEPFWIGLRFFCGSGALQWVDGTDASQSKFSAWATKWARRDDITCSTQRIEYMPVSYTTKTPTKSLKWQATGPEKGYVYYLVEYSTGKE
ncbi:MAG: C-type lectin domain-containing protein [Emcibacter sp.]|nr:C-type lectin domain-containing protein [Emcibacter sp.]